MRFTVRRPPIGEVSPCGHRPSGGDVACSIGVGVAPSGSRRIRTRRPLGSCGFRVRRARMRSIVSTHPVRPGACSSSPVDSAADTATPRSMPTTLPSPDRDRVGDVRERDMPAARPITGNPVGLDAFWHRPRQPEPHPPDLGYPDPTEAAVQPLDVTRFHSDLPKALVHTGFTPCRAAVRAGEEVPHGLREIPQRLLLHCLTSGPKPRVLGAGLRQLRGLLQIAGSLCGPVASAAAAPPPSSTHTAHPGSAPTLPPPVRGSAKVGTAT